MAAVLDKRTPMQSIGYGEEFFDQRAPIARQAFCHAPHSKFELHSNFELSP
jgi:hypothetical protein